MQLNATKLYVDNMTDQGFDPTAMFIAATFADEIIIQDRDNATSYQVWKMLGPATTYTGWFEVPIQYVSAGGTSTFTNNQEIAVLLRTRGQQGIPGPWTQVTQAQYNALSPPDPYTLYVIIG